MKASMDLVSISGLCQGFKVSAEPTTGQGREGRQLRRLKLNLAPRLTLIFSPDSTIFRRNDWALRSAVGSVKLALATATPLRDSP